MEFLKILPMILTVAFAILGSYITIRIAIAEIKKDIVYLKEKIEGEIIATKESEDEHKETMKEVRSDVKAIFSTLTKIQVDFAKNQGKNEGRDEVLNVVKDAISTIARNNNRA
jgi:hypothetical protein